jgi:hypothetical protein
MSTFDDPNRESVGLPPIWTVDGAGEGAGEGTGAPLSAAFDPSAHTVEEVNAYLAEHPDEEDEVLELERAGKSRAGVLGG